MVVEKAGVLSPEIETPQPSVLLFSRHQTTISRVCLPPITPLITNGGTVSSVWKSFSDLYVLGETFLDFLGSQISGSQRMPGLLPGVTLTLLYPKSPQKGAFRLKLPALSPEELEAIGPTSRSGGVPRDSQKWHLLENLKNLGTLLLVKEATLGVP